MGTFVQLTGLPGRLVRQPVFADCTRRLCDRQLWLVTRSALEVYVVHDDALYKSTTFTFTHKHHSLCYVFWMTVVVGYICMCLRVLAPSSCTMQFVGGYQPSSPSLDFSLFTIQVSYGTSLQCWRARIRTKARSHNICLFALKFFHIN